MGEKPKRGLTEEQWAEVRKEYEASGNTSALSRKWGVKRETIISHRDKEGWVPPTDTPTGQVSDQIGRQTRAQVISIATGKAIDQIAQTGAVERIAAEIATSLQRQSEIERLLLDVAAYTLRRMLRHEDENGDVLPALRGGEMSSEASEIKDAVSAAKIAVDVSRMIAGKKLGMPSAEEQTDNNEPLEILQRRLETKIIPVDERGRAINQ